MAKDKRILLTTLRASRGLSQRELAKQTSVSASSIASYETGVRKPTLENALKIASFFNIPAEQIKFNSKE